MTMCWITIPSLTAQPYRPHSLDNIPLGMVLRLRKLGHDVLAIMPPGVFDTVLLDRPLPMVDQ